MNPVELRQGKKIGVRPVRNVNGELLRYDTIFQKRSLKELTIAQTRNTDAYCINCMGLGTILHDSSRMGLIEGACPRCNGKKRIKN